MKIHNIFFIDLLEIYVTSQDDQNSFKEESVLMNSEAEWEVFRVIDFKVNSECSFLYLVHWEDPWDDIWELSESLWNISEVLKTFHCSCLNKLKLKAWELSSESLNDEENKKDFWADWVLFIYSLIMCLNVSSMQLFITKFIFEWVTFCIQKVPLRPLHVLAPGRSEDIAAQEGDIVRCTPGS